MEVHVVVLDSIHTTIKFPQDRSVSHRLPVFHHLVGQFFLAGEVQLHKLVLTQGLDIPETTIKQ